MRGDSGEEGKNSLRWCEEEEEEERLETLKNLSWVTPDSVNTNHSSPSTLYCKVKRHRVCWKVWAGCESLDETRTAALMYKSTLGVWEINSLWATRATTGLPFLTCGGRKHRWNKFMRCYEGSDEFKYHSCHCSYAVQCDLSAEWVAVFDSESASPLARVTIVYKSQSHTINV